MIDKIADRISKVIGRTVSHVSLSEHAFAEHLRDKVGMPDNYANMLAALDIGILKGSEARVNSVVQTVTGRVPKNFDAFAQANKEKWDMKME